MGENSKIEWTDHTFNAWVGCTKLSPACDHCYAERWANRVGQSDLWQGERRLTSAANWKKPLRWNAAAEALGHRARVFCCSLADVFDNQASAKWRFYLFYLIRRTPWLEWQLLTKRPQNIVKMARAADGLPPNVALGTTTENQEQANIRVPALLEAAAKLHPLYTFISAEPLLGSVDLTAIKAPHLPGTPDDSAIGWAFNALSTGDYYSFVDDRGYTEGGDGPYRARAIDWVIAGGESGPHARPMHPEWARSLRNQCAAAGVAFFFKQWGEWAPMPEWYENHHTSLPLQIWKGDCWSDDGGMEGEWLVRVGKKRAGRLLDGKEHNEFPRKTDILLKSPACEKWEPNQ